MWRTCLSHVTLPRAAPAAAVRWRRQRVHAPPFAMEYRDRPQSRHNASEEREHRASGHLVTPRRECLTHQYTVPASADSYAMPPTVFAAPSNSTPPRLVDLLVAHNRVCRHFQSTSTWPEEHRGILFQLSVQRVGTWVTKYCASSSSSAFPVLWILLNTCRHCHSASFSPWSTVSVA